MASFVNSEMGPCPIIPEVIIVIIEQYIKLCKVWSLNEFKSYYFTGVVPEYIRRQYNPINANYMKLVIQYLI